MKELSIEEKAKAYDEAKARMSRAWNDNRCTIGFMNEIFPEPKESEDDRIKNKLIKLIKMSNEVGGFALHKWEAEEMLAWLEKQGNTNDTTDRAKFIQAVLQGVAINLITWIDYKVAEVNMCLSNTECKDIIDALANYNWDKIYDYMKKKLEKQGEQKDKIFDFKSNDWYVSKVDGKIHNMTYNPNNKVEHPMWTEEDEERLQSCISSLQGNGLMGGVDTINTKWLKSLKQRMI